MVLVISRLPERFCAPGSRTARYGVSFRYKSARGPEPMRRGRNGDYGLNFGGIAAACSGVSGVIVLTMQGMGMSWMPELTFSCQSSGVQIVLEPRMSMIRCAFGHRSAGQVPLISSL